MKTNSMYCPACGTENSGDDRRFCRACGTDLRVVSQALNQSVPVKIASTLDAYLENRFQRNFMNGVLNLIAFLALLVAGTNNLISGWTLFGGLLLGLGLLRCSWEFGTFGSIAAIFHSLRNKTNSSQLQRQKN